MRDSAGSAMMDNNRSAIDSHTLAGWMSEKQTTLSDNDWTINQTDSSWPLPSNTSAVAGTQTDMYYYAGAEELERFHDWYRNIHGYLATAVCILGIVANTLNILVLTRKNMVSATNCILTGLAVSDGFTMVAYLPFALRFYCLYGTQPSPERNTLGAIHFMLFYACFSVVVHTISIWLTVTLAVFRYIFVRYPRQGCTMYTLRRAKLSVLLVYIVTVIVCIPNFVTITIYDQKENITGDIHYLWYVGYKRETKMEVFVSNFNFWIQAILVKLLPCIGLTVLIVLLVRTMKRAEAKRKHLMKNTHTSKDSQSSRRERKTVRTTRMLVAVVVLFILTEFPQGILNLLSGILPQFVEQIYEKLGDLVDILALINSAVNFILYCAMSKQFRDTFLLTFIPASVRKNKVQQSFQLVSQTANITV